jgi:hypothetical protein
MEGFSKKCRRFQHLSHEEAAVFVGLKEDRWGRSVRLEQERISEAHVQEQLRAF